MEDQCAKWKGSWKNGVPVQEKHSLITDEEKAVCVCVFTCLNSKYPRIVNTWMVKYEMPPQETAQVDTDQATYACKSTVFVTRDLWNPLNNYHFKQMANMVGLAF